MRKSPGSSATSTARTVPHADLSGRILVVDKDHRILLCDFGGSYIDDEGTTIIGEMGFVHPDRAECKTPTICGEIHMLTSTIFGITTGSPPYSYQSESGKEAADELMARREYPEIGHMRLGPTIRKCWDGKFDSAVAVAEEIPAYRSAHSSL